ncbi:MAG: hypothetical protein ABIX28_00575 [Vicinamibacterales bacterium]
MSTDVALSPLPQAAPGAKTTLINTPQTISLRCKDRRVVHVVQQSGWDADMQHVPPARRHPARAPEG